MKIWRVSASMPQLEAELQEAAHWLRSGRVIAFPTETVYGLGADARNEVAVRQIFQAKGRPSDNPLIVHIPNADSLSTVTSNPESLPATVKRAIHMFWPGPLTLLLPAHPALAPSVHPGVDTVGVRVPAHPVASALLGLAGCPVAAPSANKSGRPSPTQAMHVIEDFSEEIEGVVDAGACQVGLESTVASISDHEVVILRPGLVTAEALYTALGVPVRNGTDTSRNEPSVLAPGMKYRHYAPNAAVTVWWGNEREVISAIARFVATRTDAGTLAVIAPEPLPLPSTVLQWTPPESESYPVVLSRELYGLLRHFDHAGASHILIHGVTPSGVGSALMNRLEKASEGRVYEL